MAVLRRECISYVFLCTAGGRKNNLFKGLYPAAFERKSPACREKVGVVDERSEIAACYRGIPQNDLGPRTDVLDNCPKEHGIHMLLRSMSPQIIAVDELGLPEDFAAVADCARCGVSILGTIHAGSVLEVLHRLQMGGLDLIRSQMRLIGLQREPDGRRILTVYEGGGNPLWQGFSEPS